MGTTAFGADRQPLAPKLRKLVDALVAAEKNDQRLGEYAAERIEAFNIHPICQSALHETHIHVDCRVGELLKVVQTALRSENLHFYTAAFDDLAILFGGRTEWTAFGAARNDDRVERRGTHKPE